MRLGWIECVSVVGVLGFFGRLALGAFAFYLWRVLFSAFSSLMSSCFDPCALYQVADKFSIEFSF